MALWRVWGGKRTKLGNPHRRKKWVSPRELVLVRMSAQEYTRGGSKGEGSSTGGDWGPRHDPQPKSPFA